jgi:peptidoglycan/LPS O-acetylase OafA/YrhL
MKQASSAIGTACLAAAAIIAAYIYQQPPGEPGLGVHFLAGGACLVVALLALFGNKTVDENEC